MALDPSKGQSAPPGPSNVPPDGRRRRWMPRGAKEALQPVAAPEPPPVRRRGGGFLGKLSAFFTFALVLIVAAGGGALYLQGRYVAPGPLAAEKVVFIPKGSGRDDIAQLLESEGVINQHLLFHAGTVMSGQSLKAGEYLFRQNASLKDVVDTLIGGRSIQHAITIPEGLTSEQIVARLMENEILIGNVREVPREGTLLPDTYKFERGDSRDQVISRMVRAQQRVLEEVWQRRSPDIPVKTKNDLVILASIVEKETGRADERTRVASVFVNRLNRGMKLESDPTIIYGLVGGKGALGRGILASEIRQPTPYNTYVIAGLPPGPIANPGRASLEAAANPSRTRDLFFVADGSGGHAFAETYEQHQRNVARWRQIEQQNRGEAAAPGAPGVTAPALAPAPPAAAVPIRPQGQRPADARRGVSAPPAATTLPGQPASPVSAYAVPAVPLDALEAPADNSAALEGVPTYPVPAARRQALGAGAPAAEVEPAAEPRTRGPRNNIDAAAGTARDPLRARNFDLNSPQTVPVLR